MVIAMLTTTYSPVTAALTKTAAWRMPWTGKPEPTNTTSAGGASVATHGTVNRAHLDPSIKGQPLYGTGWARSSAPYREVAPAAADAHEAAGHTGRAFYLRYVAPWAGRRGMAGAGALVGGLLGAVSPGKDDEGRDKSMIGGAVQGALGGAALGGLAGFGTRHVTKSLVKPQFETWRMQQQQNNATQQTAAHWNALSEHQHNQAIQGALSHKGFAAYAASTHGPGPEGVRKAYAEAQAFHGTPGVLTPEHLAQFAEYKAGGDAAGTPAAGGGGSTTDTPAPDAPPAALSSGIKETGPAVPPPAPRRDPATSDMTDVADAMRAHATGSEIKKTTALGLLRQASAVNIVKRACRAARPAPTVPARALPPPAKVAAPAPKPSKAPEPVAAVPKPAAPAPKAPKEQPKPETDKHPKIATPTLRRQVA